MSFTPRFVRPWTPVDQARLVALIAALDDVAQSFRDILPAGQFRAAQASQADEERRAAEQDDSRD